MSKTIKTVAATLLIVFSLEVLIFTFAIRPKLLEQDALSSKIDEIQSLIDKNAVLDFDSKQAEKNAILGYMSGLDDHYINYWVPDDYQNYLDEQDGNFTGVGMTVQSQNGAIIEGLLVLRVIGNSPAENAGIKSMDRIIEVDGENIVGKEYQDVVNKILGEENTDVSIKVLRDGTELEAAMTRKKFIQREVDYRIINNDIGYIQIHDFNTNAFDEFNSALNELISKGVKGFIFDVRNNPGGEFQTIRNILDLLVPEDELVILQYKERDQVYKSTGNRKTDLPMTVLVNNSSASASELFASALRDLNQSPLIGQKTFGKGIGQTTFTLYDGSGVKFTTFHYLTKSRTNYNEIGLVPDYDVEMSEENLTRFYALEESEDNQLQKAIEVISGMY